MPNKSLLLAGAACFIWSPGATAQSLGGVFGPVVNEDQASAQFRTGYNPERERWAHRVHYQQSISGAMRWRGILQVRETADSDVDFDSVGAELFWQVSDDADSWQRGLRFDVRLRDDDRPGSFGAHWMNQWALSGPWRVRANIMTTTDFGDNSRDGVFLQTRGQLNRSLGGGRSVGLEVFSAYGSTDDFRSFDEQSHEIGPYVILPVGEDWSVLAQVLAGLTDGSPDSNLKLWLTRRF